MSKRYRLLKDLPDVNEGAIAEWDASANAYKMEKTGAWVSPHRYHWLSKGTVEQSPEWFELINDRIEVLGFSFDKEPYNNKWGNVIKVHVPYTFKYELESNKIKLELIKQAIERVLNGDDNIFLSQDVVRQLGVQYTQEQLDKSMEDAFNAARERGVTSPGMDRGYRQIYDNFQHYLTSINNIKQ